MKMKNLLTSLALVSIVFIGGCKKDDFKEITGTCPAVLTTNPTNLETDVSLNQIITVNFNEMMNPATINQTSFTLQEGTPIVTTAYQKSASQSKRAPGVTPIEGSVTASGTTASFKPSSLLAANTAYTAIITTAIKDVTGNAIQADYVWTFTTGTTLSTPPIIISTEPQNNDIDVALNKVITVGFSVPMDPLSITTNSFTLKQGLVNIAGAVSYTASTASFKPTVNLLAGTIYTAKMTTEVTNTAGIALSKDSVWTFTTGNSIGAMVISTDPMNNATGVILNKIITATFNVPMDALTLTAATFTVKLGATNVPGTISYIGSTVSFTPTAGLLSGNTYTATITTGAKTPAGVPLANNYVWNFSTKAPLGPLFVDLKSVEEFGIIAGVGVSNNAGFSEIHDLNVGIYPGLRSSITGFPPAIIVNGAMYAADDIAPAGVPAMLLQAKDDLTAAYLFAEGATSPAPATVSGDIGGTTLAPGIYKSTSTLLIQSGDLTLDAQGDENAVWIFQVAAAFTTVGGAGGNVILSGGAQAKNVFWQTGSSATIGDYTIFKGNVLALTSITMNGYTTIEGRMLARNGSVVMTHTDIITKP